MVVSLPRTRTVSSPSPSRRTLTAAVSPARTAPLIWPTLPVAGSSTVMVKEPAFTMGSQKRPNSSVTTVSSWIPCGIESHSSSPVMLFVVQITRKASDL